MYLDEWPELYSKDLIISKNVGVDAAPWNISQYNVTNKDGKVFIDDNQLICYHFHQFQILGPAKFNRVYGFTLSENTGKCIYKPYEVEIIKQYEKIKLADPSFKIEPVSQYSQQILRQKLAKYLGPLYWKLKKLVYTLR